MSKSRSQERRAGFSLVEMAIATTVLVALGAGLTLAVGRLRSRAAQGSAQSSLEVEAARARASITHDLRKSGVFTDDAGTGWPQLFAGGPDGQSREVVYRLPQLTEDPATRRTTAVLDENGERVWDDRRFRLELMDDGRLLRTAEGEQPVTFARHVQRIVVDDNASSGYTVPLDALRVRMDFARTDDSGRSLRLSREWTVQLRNRD
jgi:predicted alpha-1,6-mannanase (GH76 family)